MADFLSWQVEARTLYLRGELERSTLISLWQQRATLMRQVKAIDVSALERVDSSGLALLVHLRQVAHEQGNTPVFHGIDGKLQSLIELYNLQQIIVSAPDPV